MEAGLEEQNMPLESINPATGEVIQRFEEWSSQKTAETIDAVDRAFLSWRERSFEERAKLVRNVAGILKKNQEEYARLMSTEMGKPVREARAEVEKCALCAEHYAGKSGEYLAPQVIRSDARKSYVRFDPLGTILGIMPWNFPFWQVFRFAFPALMAGNTCLLKHSSNVPQISLVLEEVFQKGGFPENTFRTVLIGSAKVASVIENSRIRGVSLTGSEPAGREVAGIAGRELKKIVLELGGSDPFVVLEDAGMEECVDAAVKARTMNSGQSCIAAKRFIVHEKVEKEFASLFKERMESLVVGDPLDEKTQVGPLARRDLMEELHQQVRRSVEKGAKILTGGEPLPGKGAFYPPTILTRVKPGMPAYEEELFGPVAAILPAKNDGDALRIANDTRFGLGASVWTKDTEKGERLARYVESGLVFINGIVKSDPRLPFGGIKASGFGRELARYGILEFVNIKTVWIK